MPVTNEVICNTVKAVVAICLLLATCYDQKNTYTVISMFFFYLYFFALENTSFFCFLLLNEEQKKPSLGQGS
jgi:hypothetical protein